MYPNQSQLLAAQKSQMEAVQAVGNTVFQAAEKFTQLSLTASRNFLHDSAGTAQSLLGAKDPQEITAIAGSFAQPSAEKLVSYSRNAYAIASAAGAELGKIFDAQLVEGNRRLSELIDAAAKSAPAGSEPFIRAFQNSVSVAGSAFDAVTKAAREAGATAESNLASVVAMASDAVKGKAKKV